MARRRRLLDSFSARNPRSARTWAVVALMVTILTNVATGAVNARGVPVPELCGAGVLAVLSVVLLRRPPDRVGPLIVLAPLVGVLTVVWLDLVTRDATLTGQVFFIVPWCGPPPSCGSAASRW